MTSMLRMILRRIFGTKEKSFDFSKFQSCGEGVEFDLSTQVVFPERIKIGSYIYIGPDNYLNGRGGLVIHDHVIFAPQVVIMTSMHNYMDSDMVPYDRVELLKPVNIEQCVWLGMRAMILPGVTIGEGSIVGAGAIVTKSCGPGTILGGNPAREIGKRDIKHYRDCVENKKFYLKQKQLLKFEKIELAQNAVTYD